MNKHWQHLLTLLFGVAVIAIVAQYGYIQQLEREVDSWETVAVTQDIIIQQKTDSIQVLRSELRWFRKYISVDSAVIENELMSHGIDRDTAQNWTRWMVAYGLDQGISPRLLLAMAKVESSYDPRAVSHADAHGLLQIMPYWWWDVYRDECGWWNPYDARLSICYSAHILAYYRRQHGNMADALSAYNSGYPADRSTQGRKYAGVVSNTLANFGRREEGWTW